RELGTRTPFPRTLLYYVLNQLMQRGLVSAKKESSRTVYTAEDPDHLYDLLTDKEQKFERETGAVRELIPLLKHQYRLAGKRPSVRTFDGAGEYLKALEDIIISKPKEILAYEMLAEKKQALEIFDTQDRRRISKKI